VTYRVSAHSSSDDPSRYRDEEITAVWRTRRDPLGRLRHLLEARGWLAAGEHEALAAALEHRVRDEIAAQEQIGPPPKSSLFDDVYEQPTWLQREQAADLLR
jgi:TPP-dependent pyruvate/acetoin dehydrogenase alpha subunit